MPKRFSWYMLAGLGLGVLLGFALHAQHPAGLSPAAADLLALPSTVFLRLIKMVIGPLIFATLASGIANMGDGRAVARVGAKAMVWFLGASLISLAIGAAMALALAPGAHLALAVPAVAQASGIKPELSFVKVVTDAFPTSIADAMATNSILQIVIFSLFAGGGLAALGERGAALTRGVNQLAALMLAITNYVMLFAPFAVCAAIAGVIAKQGPGVLVAFAALIGDFYLSLGILIALLLLSAWGLTGHRLLALLAGIRAPALLAFATSSSESAYPRVLAGVEGFGVSNRIASFVLPLGYSFNLDASMMYCAFGSLFIAQAYGIPLSGGQIVTMMLMLMLASKGIAAIPRGALVAIAATIPHFGLPDAGILLLLGIDHLMNMGRSATNVLGNAVAIVAVARWEGEIAPADGLVSYPDALESRP